MLDLEQTQLEYERQYTRYIYYKVDILEELAQENGGKVSPGMYEDEKSADRYLFRKYVTLETLARVLGSDVPHTEAMSRAKEKLEAVKKAYLTA